MVRGKVPLLNMGLLQVVACRHGCCMWCHCMGALAGCVSTAGGALADGCLLSTLHVAPTEVQRLLCCEEPALLSHMLTAFA